MKTDSTIECNDEAARLLPWYGNGTLGSAETRRVAAHLEHCPTCRAAAAHLDAVRTLLRSPAQVEYAPQASLRRLMARVEQDARAAVATAVPPTPPVAAPPAVAAPQRRRPALRKLERWLAVAVTVQALAIAAIVGAHYFAPPVEAPAAQFRTLTTNASEGPRLRVVFAPTMTLAELQDLLRANQLVAVAGPSDAGIFTLALRAPAAGAEAQAAVLARLRADARVRFAEPVGNDGGAR